MWTFTFQVLTSLNVTFVSLGLWIWPIWLNIKSNVLIQKDFHVLFVLARSLACKNLKNTEITVILLNFNAFYVFPNLQGKMLWTITFQIFMSSSVKIVKPGSTSLNPGRARPFTTMYGNQSDWAMHHYYVTRKHVLHLLNDDFCLKNTPKSIHCKILMFKSNDE